MVARGDGLILRVGVLLAGAGAPPPWQARLLAALEAAEWAIVIRLAALPAISFPDAPDVLLNLTTTPTNHPARHGEWRLRFGTAPPGAPPGIYEIARGEPFTPIRLVRAAPPGEQTIATARLTTAWSVARARRLLGGQAVALVLRSLRLLAQGALPESTPTPTLPVAPRTPALHAHYAARIGVRIAHIAAARARATLGGTPHRWSLFLARGAPPDRLADIRELPNPPRRFRADPFVFAHDAHEYCFFEEYDYSSRRGHIAVGVLSAAGLSDVRAALVAPHHLSWPHVFAWRGEVFMIPETIAARRLEVWRATRFPDAWTLHATAFHGQAVSDPVFHVHDTGQPWLFASMSDDPGGFRDAELRVFAVSGPDLENIRPHRLNPVKLDVRGARAAGPIFRDAHGWVRPGQVNAHGRYGSAVALARIVRLTLEDYAEEPLGWIGPSFAPGLVGAHHLCRWSDGWLLDGRRA